MDTISDLIGITAIDALRGVRRDLGIRPKTVVQQRRGADGIGLGNHKTKGFGEPLLRIKQA